MTITIIQLKHVFVSDWLTTCLNLHNHRPLYKMMLADIATSRVDCADNQE